MAKFRRQKNTLENSKKIEINVKCKSDIINNCKDIFCFIKNIDLNKIIIKPYGWDPRTKSSVYIVKYNYWILGFTDTNQIEDK